MEADNPRENALQKLRAKNCDIVVVNSPSAIGAVDNQIELIDCRGSVVLALSGPKTDIAGELVRWIENHLNE